MLLLLLHGLSFSRASYAEFHCSADALACELPPAPAVHLPSVTLLAAAVHSFNAVELLLNRHAGASGLVDLGLLGTEIVSGTGLFDSAIADAVTTARRLLSPRAPPGPSPPPVPPSPTASSPPLLRGVRLWLRRTPLVRAGKAALHIATHPPPPAIVRRLLHAVVFPIVFGGPRPPVRVLPALGDALAEARIARAFVSHAVTSAMLLALFARLLGAERIRRKLRLLRRARAARTIVCALRRYASRRRLASLQRKHGIAPAAAAASASLAANDGVLKSPARGARLERQAVSLK